MSVICPVTNKECPYLKKLDTDICPREHTCDAVRESYSGMIQKPPAPRKFLIILFSSLLAAVIGLFIVYFFVLNQDLSVLGFGKNSSENQPPVQTPASIAPTHQATPEPTQTPAATPGPAATPVPSILPDVPVTSSTATMPVRIEINDQIAEIKSVSLDENQNIAVLPTALAISWYEGSYMPGESGNCILFGYKHYDGMAGMFFNLDTLQKGDIVEFTLDNGSKLQQKVTQTTIYAGGFLPEEVLALENETPRTVIISETGDIDPQTGGYKDLIVVITE